MSAGGPVPGTNDPLVPIRQQAFEAARLLDTIAQSMGTPRTVLALLLVVDEQLAAVKLAAEQAMTADTAGAPATAGRADPAKEQTNGTGGG